MAKRGELSGLPCKKPGCDGRTWVLNNLAAGRNDEHGPFVQRMLICEKCNRRYKSTERIEGDGWDGPPPPKKLSRRRSINTIEATKSPCLFPD